MKRVLKGITGVISTLVLWFITGTIAQIVQSAWTTASMQSVVNPVGNQIAYERAVAVWTLVYYLTWVIGFILVVLIWRWLFKEEVRSFRMPPASFMLLVVTLSLGLAGCTERRFEFITPPDRALVINLTDTSNQGTSPDFGKAVLNVGKVEVVLKDCNVIQSSDKCPDKLVFKIPGNQVTKIYSAEANSGTSTENQAMCFEANGANGCLDFTATVTVSAGDEVCYLEKNGYSAVKEADDKDSRFLFSGKPIETVMDNHLVGIASGRFNLAVIRTSPLQLAFTKFDLFEDVKKAITDEFHERTCITVLNLSISNGIVWGDEKIQDQINEATVLANQLELVKQQNNLAKEQMQGFIDRALLLEQQFGLQAAIEFMKIQKWDGSYLPALPGAPALTPVSPASTSVSAPTTAP